MTEQKVSSRYARAIMDVAEQEAITANVLEDFQFIKELLKQSRELLNLIHSPIISVLKKKDILKEILENKVNILTLNFVLLLVDKRREDLILSIIEQFRNIFDINNNRLRAEITSATELTSAIKEQILAKFSSLTGKTILPEYKTDPKVKGGVMIRVDDLVYDATLKTQLKLLEQTLNGTRV